MPIVVLAGDDDASAALDALRNGAEDFLSREELDPGGIRRSLSYAIERCAAHEARAEERRLTGIGETALGLRHQINNPLAALLLNVELLKEGRRGDRKDAIMNIEIAAKQIAAVIRRIEGLRTPRSIAALGEDRMVDFSGSEDAQFDPDKER
ncbi:MAG TPA: histidine kinase dimerization/phospho-acceptor domain-containing protein [Gemmatimonadaceae bacterium]|nr:histidine kinase dimerization/phospho-acceptor domain-containing protein [Gemmatimonadaceae bacterium]